MNITVVFSADELKHAQVDVTFRDQAEAFREAGIRVWTYALDEEKLVTRGDIVEGATVVYRGWMLSAAEYEAFANVITARGGKLLTSLDQYLASHRLPGWYSAISELTPETRLFPVEADLKFELSRLGWGKFFIKDHVKSLKTGDGAIVAEDGLGALLEKMKHFRGTIEGGIAVRRVEDFIPETESRYFVLNAKVFAAHGTSVPQIAEDCAAKLRGHSNFFSIDVIERRDGQKRIVEVGDGQVSDLVGWSVQDFVQIWQET